MKVMKHIHMSKYMLFLKQVFIKYLCGEVVEEFLQIILEIEKKQVKEHMFLEK